MNRNEKLECLVMILAKNMHYGDWKWETSNERVMEMLMRDLGYYPFENEDEMIANTSIPEQLYIDAIVKIKSK